MRAYHLTREQLEACSFVRTEEGQYFFLVQSATKPGVVYKVYYNPAMKRLQCVSFDGGPVCKASEDGYNCWHKRASMARAILVRLERTQQQEREVAQALAERGPQEIAEQETRPVPAVRRNRAREARDIDRRAKMSEFRLMR